ncbi:TAXI family TRAP transporter solute-binding subunit [Martelella lutilitoris]|uniref:TAXI family TRAP transporter solute-binding subunit n=1 Tax=Martelella lutilitoris TaxID=2583532 RepID=A0A5C4JST1_9HYPH|nr:TAXI family TRAP transporter solute-binding subunit [Martelella lutilitoris]TNB47729.1 TAXI family TRAP transporter solute-binding subunit [Martelella lutilitoris]
MHKSANAKVRGITAAVFACGLLSFGAGAASAQDQTDISLISAPFGTGSYVMGSALEEISKKNGNGVRITHTESPGFVFNIKKLDAEPDLKASTIVGSGGGVLGLAEAGDTPFDKAYEPLKLIANYNLNSSWLATLDPDIKTIEDLKGKKIAVGRRAQINWAIQPVAILKDGYGFTDDDIDIEYVGTQEAVNALLDGTADAAVVGGYIDPVSDRVMMSPQTIEFLASGRKPHHLQWGAEQVAKARDAGISMANATIPAGADPSITEPMEGFADSVAWMVAPEFPDEEAYQVTKLILENIDQFGEYQATGKLMSPEGMIYGWDVEDIHPGALRAYREAGLIK